MRNYVNHRRSREIHEKKDPDWVDFVFNDAQLVCLHQVSIHFFCCWFRVVDRKGLFRELRGHHSERTWIRHHLHRTFLIFRLIPRSTTEWTTNGCAWRSSESPTPPKPPTNCRLSIPTCRANSVSRSSNSNTWSDWQGWESLVRSRSIRKTVWFWWRWSAMAMDLLPPSKKRSARSLRSGKTRWCSACACCAICTCEPDWFTGILARKNCCLDTESIEP